jgi:hypothetical protein
MVAVWQGTVKTANFVNHSKNTTMNFVKVRATSPHINLNLFVPEKEIGKTLKDILEIHGKTPMDMQDEYRDFPGLSHFVNKNFLSVTMRRVRIEDKKARKLKQTLAKLAIINH